MATKTTKSLGELNRSKKSTTVPGGAPSLPKNTSANKYTKTVQQQMKEENLPVSKSPAIKPASSAESVALKAASQRASIPIATQTETAKKNMSVVTEKIAERRQKKQSDAHQESLKKNAASVIPKNADFLDVVGIVTNYAGDAGMLEGMRLLLADELEENRKAYHKFGDDNVYFIDAESDILSGNVPKEYEKLYDFDAFRTAHDKHKKSLLKYNYVLDAVNALEAPVAVGQSGDIDKSIKDVAKRAEEDAAQAEPIKASTKPRSDVAYADYVRRNKATSPAPGTDRPHDSYKNTMYMDVVGTTDISNEIIKAADYYDKHKDNKYADNLGGRVAANYRMGETGVRSNYAGYTSMKHHSDNIAANDIYEALSERLYNNNLETYLNNTGFEEFIANNASYAPQFMHQLSAQVKGRVLGTAAGAAGGWMAAGSAGAAIGAKRGGDLGAAYESAKFMYRQTAGASYVNILRKTGNTEVAYEMANNVALANAAIEFSMELAVNTFLGSVGLLKKPLGAALGESAESISKYLAKKGISEAAQHNFGVATRFVANGLVNMFSESSEEYFQEGVAIQSEYAVRDGEHASVLDLLSRTFNDEFETASDYERMRQAKKAALMISFFGSGVKAPGVFHNIRTNAKTQNAIDTVSAFRYLTGPEQMEFDDLSPAAQKLVRKEFSDHPQDLQAFIQQKSPTGSLSKEAQMVIDAAVDVAMGKKDQTNVASKAQQYRIVNLSDGKKYVEASREEIKGKTPQEWAQNVADRIDDEVRKGHDIQIVADDGDVLKITIDTSWKSGSRNLVTRPDGTKTPMTDDEYRTKLSAELHIDEIGEASRRGKGHRPDTKNHPFAKDGFHYRTAYYKDYDGKYYKLRVSVGENGNVNTIYNIGQIKEASLPKVAQRPGAQGAGKRDASTENIPQAAPLVNTESSPKSDIEAIADDIPMRHIDGSVRSYREYAADKTAPAGTTIAPNFTGTVAVEADVHPRIRNVMDTIYNKTGIKVGFAERYLDGRKDDGYRGHYDRSTNTIYFRKGATNAEILYKTAIHELTHSIEKSSHYKYVSEYVIGKKFGGIDSEKYKMALQKKISDYAKYGETLSPEAAHAELIADRLRETVFASGEEVRRIVEQDYTFGQHIHDWIGTMLYRINKRFGNMDEKAQLQADLEEAQRRYRLALAGSERNKKSNAKYSIVAIEGKLGKYGQGVLLDTNIFDGIAPRNWNRILSKYVYDKLAGKILHVVNRDGTTETISFAKGNERVQKEGAKNSHKVIDKLARARGNVNALSVVHISELLQTASKTDTNPEHSHQWLDENGWELKKAYVQTINGDIYETTLNIGMSRDGRKILYALSNTKRIDEGDVPSIQKERGSHTNHQFSFGNIPQFDTDVKHNVLSDATPKTDIEAIADDIPMRHIDGSVRTYREYAAEQEAKKQDAPPPADTEVPTANPDVAAAVNAPGVKRAEDIELQYTQRLKGKNAMLFKDLPRVLDYVCDKMPGVRDFWRNRVEKPFWAAKASFARRTEAALEDLRRSSEELGILVGSKESAATQWYGEGYRTVQKKNPMYEHGNGEPKYVAERENYTLADLKRDFPDTWENIVAFDKKARSIYEQYIVELNTMLEKIYPDAEVRLQIEISDLRRDINTLRNKPDELFAERETLERDIASIEASIADLKQRRDSGSDIAGTLGALEQRREQKQSEFDALKNKGTKKAAHIETQVSKATDRADTLRQSDRERLDQAIQAAEKRLTSKMAQLDDLRIETSERAMEINAENIRAKEAEVNEKIRALETGEALIGKRVQYRKDYYHHFQATATGFRGLANILFDSDEIDPRLVGVSDNTKPKSKWADFMQRQGIGNYDADAVGGLLKYIQAAEYKLAFDPIVSDMRSVIKTIAEDTSETRNANGFILYLTRWTDTLAGKTSFLDRPLQEITQRKVTKAINWLNSRAKGNTILGSFRNFFAQFMNLPNGFLYVQDMKAWGKGIKNAISTLNKNSQAKATIEQSAFLTERYINDVVDSFKRVPLKQFAGSFKKGAIAMMNFGDKFASNIIWNAAYAQGQNQGLTGDELMMYADDITRRAVAGRGVGEMAPALESKWLNLMAPFQVEVNNTWNSLMQVIRGKGGKKVEHRLRAIMMFEGAAWGLNAATQALGIGKMLPSMLGMLGEVFEVWRGDDEEEEEQTTQEKMGKTGALALNEFVSYLPFASTVLPVLFDVEEIESFLGADNEITRYGGGNLGVSGILSGVVKAAQGDVAGGTVDLITGYAMPWGGNQTKKIYEGIKDFGGFNDAGISASYTADGRLRFPMERTPGNIAKGLAFGKYATKEGKAYIDEGGKPLSEKRTTEFNNNVHGGMDPAEAYKTVNTLTDAKITNDVTRQKAYALMDCGFSAENAAKHIKTINKIESDKDGTGNTIDGSKRKKQIRYIYQLNIPDKQKGALYRECIIGADDKKLLLLQAYGISDAQLAQAYPLLAVTEGTKGANGKTVSGSKNKNISAVLAHIPGLTNVQKDALKVMFMTGSTQEYYEKAMVDALLHSSRLNTAQKKDFYSYYYNDDKRVNVDALREAIMRK